MSQKKTFIKTTDKNTANTLMSLGFQLVSQDGTVYTFLNKPSTSIAFDNNNVVYTNILSM